MTATATRPGLSISRDALSAALAQTTPVIRRASPLAIVQTVRWDGRTITATDLDVTVIVHLPNPAEDEFPAVCIHGQTLAKVVSTLAKGDLTFAWTTEGATITSKGDRFSLPGISAEEFPLLEVVDGPTFTMPAPLLSAMLAAVRYTLAEGSAEEQSRPMFTGVHLRERQGRLVMEGLNGHRMALYPTEIAVPKGLSCCVPGPTADRIAALAAEAEGDVTFTVEPTRLAVEQAGAWRLVTRLIEGQFPNVEVVIHKGPFKATVRFHPDAWLEALTRVATMVDEVQSKVVFELHQGRVVMQAANQKRGTGKASAGYERVEGETPLTFALNVDYIRDLLANHPTDDEHRLTLKIPPKQPLIFEGQPSVLALIMPLVDIVEKK